MAQRPLARRRLNVASRGAATPHNARLPAPERPHNRPRSTHRQSIRHSSQTGCEAPGCQCCSTEAHAPSAKAKGTKPGVMLEKLAPPSVGSGPMAMSCGWSKGTPFAASPTSRVLLVPSVMALSVTPVAPSKIRFWPVPTRYRVGCWFLQDRPTAKHVRHRVQQWQVHRIIPRPGAIEDGARSDSRRSWRRRNAQLSIGVPPS